jgi:hypothetical protein
MGAISSDCNRGNHLDCHLRSCNCQCHPWSRGFQAKFAALAAALAVMLAPASSPSTLHSPNWSGYVAVACGTCKFRYVTASWQVPAVNCAASPLPVAQADAWVGLDGLGTSTVEQVGTTSACTDGVPSYYAWYQMYPAQPVVAYGPGRLSYDVNAGDAVTASVYYNVATGQWQLVLYDHGTGMTVAASQPCPVSAGCGNLSAEVITEAPNAGANVPLADFGAMTFTGIALTNRNGTHGSMASGPLWTVHPVDLISGTDLLASPGPVCGGTSFTDSWLAAS